MTAAPSPRPSRARMPLTVVLLPLALVAGVALVALLNAAREVGALIAGGPL